MIYLMFFAAAFAAAYFSKRYLSLHRELKRARYEVKDLGKALRQNRILKCGIPDRTLEEFLVEVNLLIRALQLERIEYSRREKEFQMQMQSISHDLRTPLTSIVGYLNLMETEALSEDNRKYLSIAENKALSLKRLIGNFYDLSRLESKDFIMNMEILDARKEVCECFLSFYQSFEQKGIDVFLETGEQPMMVYADREALERICSNMIQNTLRYGEHFVRIRMEDGAEYVSLQIENETTGIGEEEVQHLFERFYRGDISRSSESSGMGLTISKYLTEAMNGGITAQIQGKRLRFNIRLWKGMPRQTR